MIHLIHFARPESLQALLREHGAADAVANMQHSNWPRRLLWLRKLYDVAAYQRKNRHPQRWQSWRKKKLDKLDIVL